MRRCRPGAAPAVFAIGDEDLPYVTLGEVGDDHIADVLRAVDACPQRAISLIET